MLRLSHQKKKLGTHHISHILPIQCIVKLKCCCILLPDTMLLDKLLHLCACLMSPAATAGCLLMGDSVYCLYPCCRWLQLILMQSATSPHAALICFRPPHCSIFLPVHLVLQSAGGLHTAAVWRLSKTLSMLLLSAASLHAAVNCSQSLWSCRVFRKFLHCCKPFSRLLLSTASLHCAADFSLLNLPKREKV
jgi:hypothetical protein